ncbi:MAG: hypothetical protein MJ094_05070 [Saccharofermentans sp.]|nr:hypothetical protein [Saccharofermentans sp.]
MHTDMRHKLLISALLAIIPLTVAALTIFIIASNATWFALYPVLVLLGAFIVTMIMTFVPFMKDHMWLSMLSVVLLAVLISLIIHFLI